MSDDGEPSGTAAPPMLAILRGSQIGDVVAVVARYFGGTKLGTGGLVRAYSDALRAALQSLTTELKTERSTLRIALPYPLYQPIQRIITCYQAQTLQESFQDDIIILIQVLQHTVEPFTQEIADISAGKVVPQVVNQAEAEDIAL
jgi:uncharacterized YigZ family protein